jgi:multiple antibiotic resistance protein
MLTSAPAALSVTVLSLFPIMNPVGNLPAFLAMTAAEPPGFRRRQALRTAVNVVLVLSVFAVGGRTLLHTLGISIPALRIAGGLIVGQTAFAMVNGGPRLSAAEHQAGMDVEDISLFPMAIPLLAGPGSMGTVIALAGGSQGAAPVAGILAGIAVMGVTVYVTLRLGEPILTRLGPAGVGALTRVFGFLILAIAVELVADGLLILAPGLSRG